MEGQQLLFQSLDWKSIHGNAALGVPWPAPGLKDGLTTTPLSFLHKANLLMLVCVWRGDFILDLYVQLSVVTQAELLLKSIGVLPGCGVQDLSCY